MAKRYGHERMGERRGEPPSVSHPGATLQEAGGQSSLEAHAPAA